MSIITQQTLLLFCTLFYSCINISQTSHFGNIRHIPVLQLKSELAEIRHTPLNVGPPPGAREQQFNAVPPSLIRVGVDNIDALDRAFLFEPFGNQTRHEGVAVRKTIARNHEFPSVRNRVNCGLPLIHDHGRCLCFSEQGRNDERLRRHGMCEFVRLAGQVRFISAGLSSDWKPQFSLAVIEPVYRTVQLDNFNCTHFFAIVPSGHAVHQSRFRGKKVACAISWKSRVNHFQWPSFLAISPNKAPDHRTFKSNVIVCRNHNRPRATLIEPQIQKRVQDTREYPIALRHAGIEYKLTPVYVPNNPSKRPHKRLGILCFDDLPQMRLSINFLDVLPPSFQDIRNAHALISEVECPLVVLSKGAVRGTRQLTSLFHELEHHRASRVGRTACPQQEDSRASGFVALTRRDCQIEFSHGRNSTPGRIP